MTNITRWSLTRGSSRQPAPIIRMAKQMPPHTNGFQAALAAWLLRNGTKCRLTAAPLIPTIARIRQ